MIIDVGSLQSVLRCDVSNGLESERGRCESRRNQQREFLVWTLTYANVMSLSLSLWLQAYLPCTNILTIRPARRGRSKFICQFNESSFLSFLFYTIYLPSLASDCPLAVLPLDLSFLRHVNLSLTCLTATVPHNIRQEWGTLTPESPILISASLWRRRVALLSITGDMRAYVFFHWLMKMDRCQ